MSLSAILLIVVLIVLLGSLPSWPYSANWGYGPSGLVGAAAAVLIVLLVLGYV